MARKLVLDQNGFSIFGWSAAIWIMFGWCGGIGGTNGIAISLHGNFSTASDYPHSQNSDLKIPPPQKKKKKIKKEKIIEEK